MGKSHETTMLHENRRKKSRPQRDFSAAAVFVQIFQKWGCKAESICGNIKVVPLTHSENVWETDYKFCSGKEDTLHGGASFKAEAGPDGAAVREVNCAGSGGKYWGANRLAVPL